MDFIVTWVNGDDPEWQKELVKYKKADDESSHRARFRDWENLRYWFRGVEKFAPWVDQIHFVTWGHLPSWLNTAHPKLHLVLHKDFIPEIYLPTFNSCTIELNFHRIKELSEDYVYFNDDMFLIDKVGESDFFKDGKPCDMGLLDVISGENDFSFTLAKNISIIRKNFNKREVLKEKKSNWFNLKYGISNNLKNLFLGLIQKTDFFGFFIHHLPQPSIKSTLQHLWDKEYKVMHGSSQHRFRDFTTVNPYLQRYWELASNNFYPVNRKEMGDVFQLGDGQDIVAVAEYIKGQQKPMICLNDQTNVGAETFTQMKKTIQEALGEILPEKSGFEQ